MGSLGKCDEEPWHAQATSRSDDLEDEQRRRRPCCFDLSACPDPEPSRNGRLLEPAQIEDQPG
jgi:hypothetical protein